MVIYILRGKATFHQIGARACKNESLARRLILRGLKCCFLLLGALHIPSNAADPNYSAIALSDLARAKQVILDAHPAVALKTDQAFNDWFIQGYDEAMKLAMRAANQAQALAAVRYYISGFRDGHVAVWDPNAPSKAMWAGWTAQLRSGEWRVVHAASKWPTSLPEKGAMLIACDGLKPFEYIDTYIAPFVDRRTELGSVLDRLALLLSNRIPRDSIWEAETPRTCTFESNGKTIEHHLDWKNSDEGTSFLNVQQPRIGVESWGENRYWIYAQQFLPARLAEDELENAISAIQIIPEKAEVVVFDARGNNGGSSLFGYQLLAALMRRDTPTIDSGAQAWWRPSRISVDWFDRLARDELVRTGPKSIRYKKILEMKNFLKEAHEKSGPSVLVADSAIEGSQYPPPPDGNSFKGRVVLLTDKHCASACLDFSDLVLAVPGSLHVGESTSSDSDYLDITVVDLPSGLQMAVPQKVWIGRGRKANEPLIPEHIFSGDIYDTPSLRAWMEPLL
ncbi:Peptidase family S41 [Variovorax sp. PDC80]|uniref:S41 family peptidase n=1 Tax=Variovorax sp. PDC80 TaxID=1882827 RepID=UPI0008E014BB|nr:S41 family peptidase [Variovorax sp. PDC80]SFO79272.1 Peptidase family S41 [Variovorax sp. PDC80]